MTQKFSPRELKAFKECLMLNRAYFIDSLGMTEDEYRARLAAIENRYGLSVEALNKKIREITTRSRE